MVSKRVSHLVVTAVVALMLVGAYVIVSENRPKGNTVSQQAPSGFMH
jgi:hypothetical protein